MNKQRVLFLCTHNSARSQMAEGFLRSMAGDRFQIASAGTEATGVHPLAVKAMAQVGVDLHGHASKTVGQFLEEPWDYVITVCDAANGACPVFPKKTRRLLHGGVFTLAIRSAGRASRIEKIHHAPPAIHA